MIASPSLLHLLPTGEPGQQMWSEVPAEKVIRAFRSRVAMLEPESVAVANATLPGESANATKRFDPRQVMEWEIPYVCK